MKIFKSLHSRYIRLKRHVELYRLMGQFDFEPVHIASLINYFGMTLGGSASYKNKIPTASNNQAWPWYTYPAIEYLSQYDFSNCTVFEYGSGSSSRFWAQRALTVTSVESDPVWYETVKSNLAPNQTVLLLPDKNDYVNSIHSSGGLFDVIIIDAIYRFNCAVQAVKRIHPEGVIILDNSDWYPNTAKVLRENGFTQIDFSGWGPINSYAWCTSLFTRSLNKISRKNEDAVSVLGGISQIGADDKLV
jgi:hypothetical protein